MRRNILLATSVLVGIAGIAASANAQTSVSGSGSFTVYGGGSSLAANLYNRTAQAIATTNDVGQNVLSEGLNTAGATTPGMGEMYYNADGSGKGQQAFVTQTPSVHSITDTGAVVAYGASDAYLTSDQIACWNSGSCTAYGTVSPTPAVKGGNLIQLPAFGTAIVVAHTNQYSKAIQLDDNDICGIYSGKITDWSGVETGTAKNRAGQAGAINVVYRQDGSGTSFLFTQHLAKVCNSGNTAAGVTFFATKYFADVFGSPSVTGSNHFIATGTPGAAFIPGSGSTGVADALTAGINLAGYLTPDFTNVAPTALSHYAKAAADLTTSITDTRVDPANSPYQYIKYAKVINSHSLKAYNPNPGGTTKGLTNPNIAGGDFSPGYPTTKIAAQVQTNWIPFIADPLDGYPIVGYTTFDVATCYANPKTTNYIKNFLTQLYLAGNKTNLTAEGFVGVPSAYSKIISSVFVKGTSTYALNIGNTTVCNSFTGHTGL